MNIFKRNITISFIWIVIIFIVISCIFLIILYYNTDNQKTLNIIGGLISGLVVAIIQLVIEYKDYMQTEKLDKLKLIKIMYDRDDRSFYENYISSAKHKIDMMGVTGIRFLKDFGDTDSHATSNAKVLLNALDRDVHVRILLPKIEFVGEHKNKDFDEVKKFVDKIKLGGNERKLDVRYFNHIPAHSICNIDDECIVGPIFPAVESKYTPALYLKSTSPVAQEYVKYFEGEWNDAE